MGMVRVRGRAPGPRQNQSENDGREISQGGPPCEISQAVPDASRAVPVLADLKFRVVLIFVSELFTRTLHSTWYLRTPAAATENPGTAAENPRSLTNRFRQPARGPR